MWLERSSTVGTDRDLCRLAVEAWPNLRELILLDPTGENEDTFQEFVTFANETAQRTLAKYERGYPMFFPLAAQFHRFYSLVGYLPNGRAAIANLESHDIDETNRKRWRVVVRPIDSAGAPTGEEIEVALDPEFKANDRDNSYKIHLQKMIGFEPGFVRVQKGALGEHLGPRRGNDEVWETLGDADNPENPTGFHGGFEPNGIGGTIYSHIRNVEFEVEYDAWADKRGYVHTT